MKRQLTQAEVLRLLNDANNPLPAQRPNLERAIKIFDGAVFSALQMILQLATTNQNRTFTMTGSALYENTFNAKEGTYSLKGSPTVCSTLAAALRENKITSTIQGSSLDGVSIITINTQPVADIAVKLIDAQTKLYIKKHPTSHDDEQTIRKDFEASFWRETNRGPSHASNVKRPLPNGSRTFEY